MVRGIQAGVTEPASDHSHVNPGGDQLDTGRVPKGMGMDALAGERRYLFGGRLNVLR